mmetsp:Transcript_10365/g.18551  ORF Transcript_10365/g.18551 Transcript_10365/m.18551 type:complete len:652 (+) Transcript_10365:220-2175(+)
MLVTLLYRNSIGRLPSPLVVVWLLAAGLRLAAAGSCVPTGAPTLRWATRNPMLVAPVSLHFDYDTLASPLSARLLPDGLAIEMPDDYTGGFTFKAADDSEDPSGNGEEYVLQRMMIRRAQLGAQVLPHSYEVALLHKLVGGSTWANVLVPVEVVNSGTSVSLLSVVEHSDLPTNIGQESYVLTHASQLLKVNEVFQDADFLHFWRAMGTQCGNLTQARFLMRSKAVSAEWELGHLLEPMLQLLDKVDPELVSGDAWVMNTCSPSGQCTTNVAQTPEEAQTYQANTEQLREQAEAEVKEREQLLQAAMATGNNAQVEAAAKDLQAATDELAQITKYATTVSNQTSSGQSAVWDADKDAVITDTSSNSSSTGNQTQALISLHNKLATPELSSTDCSAMRQSPVAIQTQKVVDPGMISPDFREPIGFKSSATSPVQVQRLHNALRISPQPGASSTSNPMPMGAVLAQRLAQGVSYVDVHVPGQHAVDGELTAAEVQIVHIPSGSRPAASLAVRLSVTDEDMDNEWLESIIPNILDSQEESSSSMGEMAQLTLLHPALEAGRIERYFRYDGTETTPPCRETAWYILEEAGYISSRQLAALREALGNPGAPALFRAGPVVMGAQTLIAKVQPSSGLRGRLTSKRKVGAGDMPKIRV